MQLSKINSKKKLTVDSKIIHEFLITILGALPILRLNGQTFYQTNAIIEWSAAKANMILDCPILRMKVRFYNRV